MSAMCGITVFATVKTGGYVEGLSMNIKQVREIQEALLRSLQDDVLTASTCGELKGADKVKDYFAAIESATSALKMMVELERSL